MTYVCVCASICDEDLTATANQAFLSIHNINVKVEHFSFVEQNAKKWKLQNKH